MDFSSLIKQHKLVDIITVDDTHYALAAEPVIVPGCTVILCRELHSYEAEFLTKGFSQRYKQQYSAALGLEPWIIFTYSLQELPAPKKQVFSHALSGTAGRKGLLISWSGEKLGRLAFLVPKQAEANAVAFFNQWHVDYKTEVVLRG